MPRASCPPNTSRPGGARCSTRSSGKWQSKRARYEIDHYWRVPRTPFEPTVVGAVEAAARSLGVGHRRMLSGAGHDAQYMAAICPTGMVFVPSRAGRSHCEEEFTPMDDIEHGANVLLLACAGLAGQTG